MHTDQSTISPAADPLTEPTSADLELVAEAEHARVVDAGGERRPPAATATSTAAGEDPPDGAGTRRGSVATTVGVAGGEAARRAIVDAVDRQRIVEVARHVARTKTRGMTDAQVMQFVVENDGFRKSLAGHLHEHLDAEDLKRIYELRKKLRMSEGRWLKLYSEHNRRGLDGAYQGVRKAGEACYAQHKLTENPQQLKKAAHRVGNRVRGKTELVVARGTEVTPEAAQGLKGVREAGRTAKGVRGMVDKAADARRVTDAGSKAAQKLTLKAGAGAAAVGVGISVVYDTKGVISGDKSVGEAAENAAWAGGEAAACTLATAGATAAAAPAIAAGTAALAGSSVAGTTALAAGLATLGPVGLGVGVGIGVGFGVKKLRKAVRG
jgi:hypothetical protein